MAAPSARYRHAQQSITIMTMIARGALGTIKKGTESKTRNFSEAMIIKSLQKACLPGNARILRRVLNISERQDMKCLRSIVYTKLVKKQPV